MIEHHRVLLLLSFFITATCISNPTHSSTTAAVSIKAAALQWCQSMSASLRITPDECAVQFGELARTLTTDDDAGGKSGARCNDDGRGARCEDAGGDVPEAPGTEHTGNQPPEFQPTPAVFNCMVTIPLDTGMNIMGYMDYLDGDTPSEALERMRVGLNREYEEVILTQERLQELVGDDVLKAAELCPPKTPGKKRKKCRFEKLQRIRCYPEARSRVLERDWWVDIARDFGLSITDRIPPSEPVTLSKTRLQTVREDINQKGYTRIPAEELRLDQLQPSDKLRRLRGMMERLHERKLPPPCIMLYDEAWQVFFGGSMDGFLTELLGGPPVPRGIGSSLWAITSHPNATREIDLYSSSVGHAPHRDGGVGAQAGEALGSLSAWLPLTDHVPPAAAIYLVPKNRDQMTQFPGAPTSIKKHQDPSPSSPLDTLFNKKISFNMQDVRALPAKAGDLLLWDGRVMHWGSSADPGSGLQSRLAIGFDASTPKPGGPPALRKFPEFRWHTRLALLCGQLFIHVRLYPAHFDFIQQHFKLCPQTRPDERKPDGSQQQWDPLQFPGVKDMYMKRKEWQG